MAYDLATLTQIRDNYVAQKLELSANYKPDYSVDGQTVSWVNYMKYLDEQIEKTNREINAFAGGEVVSFGF